MKIISIQNFCNTAFLAAILYVSGCADTVRDDSAGMIAERVIQVSTPDKQGLTWFAPELHTSHYRTLFYGYDTLDYRLAASESPETTSNEDFRLLIDASYGGDLRHYDFARFTDAPTRTMSHHQHVTERCQIFNSLISSCLYRDQISLKLSRADLEKAHDSGLQLILASAAQQYERIDLPSSYIQGFLQAIKNRSQTKNQRP